MRDLNQQIIKFNYEQNFKYDDFYVSKSNEHIFNLIISWPKWEKKLLNISGEHFSGKSHLVDIFLKKFKGIKYDALKFNDDNLNEIKLHENIILENLNENINQKLIYTLINIIEQDNKYLIITSSKPIVNLRLNLPDLISRFKNFLLHHMDKPDDELMFALILKNLSDRQISLEKKLIDYIIKRIDRSYGKIFDFIYKVDEMSLKKKRSIDFKLIKEALGE